MDESAGFREELHGELVRIRIFVNDALDAAVDDKAGANGAWLVCAVKRRAFESDAELRRLADRVLFRVDGVAFLSLRAACDAETVSHAIAFVAAGGNA